MAWELQKQAKMPATVIYCLCNQQSRIQKSLPIKFFRIRQTVSNEFQCKKIVLCQQQTPPLHTLLISSLFYLLVDEGQRETSKAKLYAATKNG